MLDSVLSQCLVVLGGGYFLPKNVVLVEEDEDTAVLDRLELHDVLQGKRPARGL